MVRSSGLIPSKIILKCLLQSSQSKFEAVVESFGVQAWFGAFFERL